MLKIVSSEKKFWDNKVEGFVIFVEEDFDSSSDINFIEKNFYPNLKLILKKHKFDGKLCQSFVLSAASGKELKQFIFVGIGKVKGDWNEELENLRRALASAIHLLKRLEIETAVLEIPVIKQLKLDAPGIAKDFAIVAHMAFYEYLAFKSEQKTPKELTLYFVSKAAEIKKSITAGEIIGKAINHARHLADTPPNILTPSAFADDAKGLARLHDLKCTVLGRAEAIKLGMGGFCAVDSGSDQDGKFVILEYKTKKKNAPTIALVGKGVTFDTGGISLKPSGSMTGMKYDMSGAAAVMATIAIVAQLGADVNIVAIAPTVENMPSGKASRQDDVIRFLNGKTAEIENTDAEGRLILADGLSYAEKFYSPDVIIDIATLTGACSVALGHFYTGLFSRDEKLSEALEYASKITGDRVWRLPLHDDFKPAIKSRVADLRNSGSRDYGAGSITGALFLENFVSKARWVHLDIAGTAHDVPGINYTGSGSTGAGIRLLTELVLNFSKYC